MIGGSESVPLCIMGSDKDTANTPLIKELSVLCSFKILILIICLKMLVIIISLEKRE